LGVDQKALSFFDGSECFPLHAVTWYRTCRSSTYIGTASAAPGDMETGAMSVGEGAPHYEQDHDEHDQKEEKEGL
jgi:hypothetical protein